MIVNLKICEKKFSKKERILSIFQKSDDVDMKLQTSINAWITTGVMYILKFIRDELFTSNFRADKIQ